jgi:hypothetical protein
MYERLTATRRALLDGRAFYSPVTAKHTTVACLRLQIFMTVFTFVKKLAGIKRHSFFLLISA